jgi:hypothetical protein
VITLSNDLKSFHYISPAINPSNFNRGAAQLNVHIGGVNARYVRINRVPCFEPAWSDADRNVLSLVQVQVMCQAAQPEELIAFLGDAVDASSDIDVARIGELDLTATLPSLISTPDSTSSFSDSTDELTSTSSKDSMLPSAENHQQSSKSNGKVIVFMQDGFWRNEFVNLAIDRRPYAHGENATRLQYSLIDWLLSHHQPRK